MSDSAQLSRYRPAILAVTGIAAAYGVYILYNTLSVPPTKNGLHRSNAIRGSRSQPPQQTGILYLPPNDDAPFGNLMVQRGQQILQFNLAVTGIPRRIDFEEVFGVVPSDPNFFHNLHVASVESVLFACLQRDLQHQVRLSDAGLTNLSMAVQNCDFIEVRRQAPSILAVLEGVTREQIELAITKFAEERPSVTRPNDSPTLMETAEDADLYIETEEEDNSDNRTFMETEEADSALPEPTQGVKGLLYHIAENDAKRKAYEHRGIHCEECGERPIRGVRWNCLNCPDFDLCSTCEVSTVHQKTHVFAKIKIPIPILSQPCREYPLWYPGDPRKLHSPLRAELKRMLQEEYDFDGPHMDAHYDQFVCIANVPWPSDPNGLNGVKAAIDRRAFNKAFTSERWPYRFRPNAILDRVFAFYDTNDDGLIGFEEFVSGLAYLTGPRRKAGPRRALEGFDIDADGYVDRKDFLRLFRASHEIQKLMVNDMVKGHENEHTQAAMETIRSSQPISSVFSLEDIPPGEDRPRMGKAVDTYGDMQPLPGTKTLLRDNEGWQMEALGRQPGSARSAASARTQHHSSRFEEMLHSPTDDMDGARSETQTNEDNIAPPSIASAQMANGYERAQTSPINGDDEADEPLNHDVLWQVLEDGFNELLDPIFAARERQDQEVLKSRRVRKVWRKEIAHAWEQLEDFKKKVGKQTKDGSSMDTAMDPFNNGEVGHQRNNTDSEPAADPDVDVNDPASWSTHSEQVHAPQQQNAHTDGNFTPRGTIGRLLVQDALGNWNIADSDSEDSQSSKGSSSTGDSPPAEQDNSRHSPDVSSALSQDPTMPQNRPNASQTPPTADLETRQTSPGEQVGGQDSLTENHLPRRPRSPMTAEVYTLLISHARLDREMRARGGPGRLALAEVEGMVKQDKTNELKGLVFSWLEWASF